MYINNLFNTKFTSNPFNINTQQTTVMLSFQCLGACMCGLSCPGDSSVQSLIEIEQEQFLVLFRPGTTSVRSSLETFFVPEPEHVNHFLCS